MNTEIERLNKMIAFHEGKITELKKRISEIEASGMFETEILNISESLEARLRGDT